MEHSSEQIHRAVAAALTPAPAGSLYTVLEPRGAICPEHGGYTSKGTRYTVGRGREIWTPCPECAELRRAEEREAAEADRLTRERARMEEMLGRAAIPVRFIGRSFDNYTADVPAQRAALTAARDYAENFSRHAHSGESLLMLGKAGTGKSHLAAAILQAIMPAHCGMYTTAADVIEMVRETWRRDSEKSQARVLHLLTTVPLLVIDEVGVQYGTESEQNTMFQIIDRRYRDRRPLILMANLQPTELQALLGDRIFDRLREVSKVVGFEWDSYRPQARRES
ncbi:MAG: putative replication protein DnaC [Nevskia sp.]|nr:putative replication protein DnaC [Nevskia sp.]